MKNIREDYMSNIMFDTLQFAKRAEQAGFTKNQAEFQAEEIAKIIETELATKRDLLDVKSELKKDIENIANRLTIKMGGMFVVAVGILATLIKF